MSKSSTFLKAARLSSVGLEMGLAVAIGWGIGTLLDKQFGSSPWLMIVFTLFGVAAGFKALLRTARQAQKDSKTTDETDGKPGATDKQE